MRVSLVGLNMMWLTEIQELNWMSIAKELEFNRWKNKIAKVFLFNYIKLGKGKLFLKTITKFPRRNNRIKKELLFGNNSGSDK